MSFNFKVFSYTEDVARSFINEHEQVGTIWDKISVVCFLNLICFGSFYLSSVFITELAPPVNMAGTESEILKTLLAFFVGFLARPLGALWFGTRGDLTSPRKAIRESALVMIFSTALMGVLPAAPTGDDLFFVLLRCVQGVGLGGCYAAMAVYLYESASLGHRGRVTSWIQFSVPVGYIAALFGVLLLKMIFAQEFYAQGGWRIAFFMPLIALFFLAPLRDHRKYEVNSSHYLPWLRHCLLTLQKQWRPWTSFLILAMALGILAFTASNFKFYFMKVMLKMNPATVDFGSGVATFLLLPFYYIGGYLSDRYDRFKVCWFSVVLGSLMLIPSFQLMEYAAEKNVGQVWMVIGAVVSVGIVLVIGFSGLVALLCDLFPQKMRCTLFAVIYSLTVGVMGGVAHTYGIQAFNESGAMYPGLILASLIAAICAALSCLFQWRWNKAV